MSAKDKPSLIVLEIRRKGRIRKELAAWFPEPVYPNVSIDKTHGWINLDGWSITPGEANTFLATYLRDVVKAWQQEYGKTWRFSILTYSRGKVIPETRRPV